ncbi:MAG: WecB/TagA/CpsF family glycosyltransferase [Oscillospiraceae bacterium]|nr:WecB/TagA/CpsF family glycosyltransferase [Oscillospiraceae bacterium]
MSIDVLGVKFDALTMQQAVSQACEIMDSGEKAYVVTPNPEIVWLCRKDESLREIVNAAGLVLPDGIGVILGASVLGTPLCERIAGIDFAEVLFAEMAMVGKSVYLFGAKPGIAEEAGRRLGEKYPSLIIAGTSDGYFDDDTPIIESINAAKADLLLVCLGSPRQERWMAENLDKLDVKLMAGLGGSLDVFAGAVKRAPVFFQRFGLEWLYRLIKQPRRIVRMIKLPLFMFCVIWRRVRGKR